MLCNSVRKNVIMEGIVNCVAYSEGRRVANIGISEISEMLRHNDKFVWVGLHEPGEELLKQVQEEFELHDLAIEDAHNAHQRPKLESYGETIFLVLRTAQMNLKDHRIDFGETHFFLGANFIVNIRHGSSLSYKDVRSRCESTPNCSVKVPPLPYML